MKRLAHFLGALVAVLPLCSVWPASAASPGARRLPDLVPLNFAIAPGCQFAPGCQPHPKTPQLSFVYVLAPGHVQHDYIAVINPSKTTPISIKLGVADGVTPPQGAGIAYNTATPREIGRWIHLSSTTATVPPGSITLIPMTVNLPRSVRPGEYTGAIVGTTVNAVTVTAGKLHYSVHGSKRCMVTLRVSGRAVAGLQIVSAGLVPPLQHALLSVMLKNTGTVIDRPTATVMTFTGAHKSYTLRPQFGAITSGDATTLTWAIANTVPAGTYSVGIHVTYMAQTVYGAPYRQLQASWKGSIVVP